MNNQVFIVRAETDDGNNFVLDTVFRSRESAYEGIKEHADEVYDGTFEDSIFSEEHSSYSTDDNYVAYIIVPSTLESES